MGNLAEAYLSTAEIKAAFIVRIETTGRDDV